MATYRRTQRHTLKVVPEPMAQRATSAAWICVLAIWLVVAIVTIVAWIVPGAV